MSFTRNNNTTKKELEIIKELGELLLAEKEFEKKEDLDLFLDKMKDYFYHLYSDEFDSENNINDPFETGSSNSSCDSGSEYSDDDDGYEIDLRSNE